MRTENTGFGEILQLLTIYIKNEARTLTANLIHFLVLFFLVLFRQRNENSCICPCEKNCGLSAGYVSCRVLFFKATELLLVIAILVTVSVLRLYYSLILTQLKCTFGAHNLM